jgi:hypothetical protein
MDTNWNHIRAHKFRDDRPSDWPRRVNGITLEGLTLLGIDPVTNKLYWDGKEIALREPIRLDWLERILAIAVAVGIFGTFIVELGRILGWWDIPLHLPITFERV